MDVATLVKSITSAFEDASTLVKRIQKRNEAEQDAHTEPIDDLLDSLSLGPTVVRGYYESDAKRFGTIYTSGDAIAREQLKDALINLQMTVLSGLQNVILDDKVIDYDAIQAASDDCRVNVGVCLGQLSQRMSKAARGMNSPGKMHMYDNGSTNAVQRSNTDSTQSSGHTKITPMTPPESDTEFLGDITRMSSQNRQKFTARAPDFDVMDGMHSASYSGLYSSPTENNNTSFHHHRPSSGTLSRTFESPISPQDYLSSPRLRDSSISTTSSRGNYPIALQTSSNQDWTNPNLTPGDSTSWSYFNNHAPQFQQPDIARSNSYSVGSQQQQQQQQYQQQYQQPDTSRSSIHNEYNLSATLGKKETSNLVTINRKPITSSTSTTFPNQSSIHRHSIPEEEEKIVFQPPPIPAYSEARHNSYPVYQTPPARDPNLPRYDSLSTGVPTRRDTIQRGYSGPVTLPTDKNLLGFCKGAFRLQIGMEKKAFVVANRPLGFSSMLQYWKCDKCYFEGPCTTIIRPGGKKPEKVFDPVIRNYGGIRYKWAFLAKSHVPLKSMVDGKQDGTYGGFCCVFCTAEGAQRGWNLQPAVMPVDKTSIKSSNSGGSSSGGTTVFGNIHGFMDHLDMHRQPEYWPGAEMQGRMKVILGRAATRGEEFDINFLPLNE